MLSAASAGSRAFATTYLSKLNERHAWIASALKSAGSRDEFDKSAAANKINFAAIVEEDIKGTLLVLSPLLFESACIHSAVLW